MPDMGIWGGRYKRASSATSARSTARPGCIHHIGARYLTIKVVAVALATAVLTREAPTCPARQYTAPICLCLCCTPASNAGWACANPTTRNKPLHGQWPIWVLVSSWPSRGGMLVGRCNDRPHVQHDQRCAVSYSFNFVERNHPRPLRHWRKSVLGRFPLSPHRLLMACWSLLSSTVPSSAKKWTRIVKTRKHTTNASTRPMRHTTTM
ncbi:hypothetical protein F5B21DRAFT_205327 [Xylaria acuta]|nr:hypothetical protein F5B21DRAFT_205327 [Xylaria acuta]